MKRLIVLSALLACALGAAQARPGSWGPQGCASVEALAVGQAQPGYKWWNHENEPGYTFLYWGNQLVGTYSYKSGFYLPKTGGSWGRPAKAPVTPPLAGTANSPAGHIFGATIDQVHREESFSHNGVETSRREVEQAIGANLRDDSNAGHVTYIDANPERRKAVSEAWAKLSRENAHADKVRFQVYDPAKKQSQAMLEPNQLERDTRFKTTGHVLVAQLAAKPGQEAVPAIAWYDDITPEKLVEAARKACPDWVPDLPKVPSMPSFPSIPWELLLLGIIIVPLGIFAIRSTDH